MADVKITVKDNGPLVVQGPLELMDAQGNKFQTNAQFGLCRCGRSHKKPFCDGTHGKEGFDSCVRAEQVL